MNKLVERCKLLGWLKPPPRFNARNRSMLDTPYFFKRWFHSTGSLHPYRLVGMDKVDAYLAKRAAQKHKAPRGIGGHAGGHAVGGHGAGGHGAGGHAGGGHAARDKWVAGSTTPHDNSKTDPKFYDAYLKKMLEKKPPYPLLKGFLQRVLDLYPDSKTWFDGGAGTCGAMEAMLEAGKDVKGVEISNVNKTSCAAMALRGKWRWRRCRWTSSG